MNDNLDSQRLGQNYYAKLRKLLVNENWKAADQETLSNMCEVVGRKKSDILSVEDIRTFPELDLFTIDRLWTKYSDDKFGFSVQKEVWQRFHEPKSYNLDWERFITAVGWRSSQGNQLKYRDLTFDKTAPIGHLPCSIYGLKPFSELEKFEVGNCKWFMVKAFADRLQGLIRPVPPASPQPASPQPPNPNKPINVFISYAREDEDLKKELERHLSVMVRQGHIKTWHDRLIQAGKEWDPAIKANLEEAQIILLLVSSWFMASDYINDVELRQAMARHKSGTARVIPIKLKPVDLKGTELSQLQTLPRNANPVTSWANRDEAFFNVAQGIRRVVESMSG